MSSCDQKVARFGVTNVFKKKKKEIEKIVCEVEKGFRSIRKTGAAVPLWWQPDNCYVVIESESWAYGTLIKNSSQM